ncbi:NAD(+)--rifampin ADP-ribosyltransferase [Mucilaginibacter puniceus]
MEFNPHNPIIKLCMQGMAAEENGNPNEAGKIFMQAHNEATNDFEKYLSAYYLARNQTVAADKLKWFITCLQFALKVDSDSVTSALPSLYAHIAKCYDELNDADNALKYDELAKAHQYKLTDKGPFYHGTRADLQVGDLLTPGGISNYKEELVMNHIYFTALTNGAGLAAALAKGDGKERVYIIEPTGSFENDPNVTDKKFPGNPSRSYRSTSPLKIVGEITDWVKISPEELQKWRERLAVNKGEIIN